MYNFYTCAYILLKQKTKRKQTLELTERCTAVIILSSSVDGLKKLTTAYSERLRT